MATHNSHHMSDEEWVEIERNWKNSLPVLSEKQKYEYFLRGTGIPDEKVRELKMEIAAQNRTTSRLLTKINHMGENDRMFCRALIKYFKIPEIIELEKQLQRFQKYSSGYQKNIELNSQFFDLEEIKKHSIVDLVMKYVSLQKSGKYYCGKCPIHDDKSPSFYVYPETNSFYCFGCHVGGNIITFVQNVEDLNFLGALKFIYSL